MRTSKQIGIKLKPTFAFVVDGECEVWYIQMLKRNEQAALRVDLKPEIPQHKSLDDQYKMVKNLAKDYDKVFWILDFDVITRETRAVKKGQKPPLQKCKEYVDALQKYSNVVVVINNPCLEYWFLLHFEATSRYFAQCEQVEKALKKHPPLSDYEKSQQFYTKQGNDIYLKLKPYLQQAMQHARNLQAFDFANHESASTTQMQRLFEIIHNT